MMELRYTGEAAEKEVFQVFNETMRELIEQDKRVVYLDADLMGAVKSQQLWKDYPSNVFNMGIQEANMVGVACGMYINGFKPYIHTFSPFASRRVFDQVFLSIGYAGKSVRIIASEPGIMATHNGGTHMSFEDVAMMQTVPGALIVDVSDPFMCGEFLKMSKDRPGLSYIRMPRRSLSDIYPVGTQFSEGKGKILKDGTDVTLIGAGIMVSTCLNAAAILEKKGISTRVIDVVTVKPLDEELIIDSAKQTKLVVVAENASIYGSLGSTVAALLSEKQPTRVIRIGIDDKYGRVGSEESLREYYGLTAENIAENVITSL